MILIIGGGLMGSCIGRALKNRGEECEIFEGNLTHSGSLCCGGAIKPSPLTGIPDRENKEILNWLDKNYGISPIKFKIRPLGNWVKVSSYLLDMENFDKEEKSSISIHAIRKDRVILANRESKKFDKVIVAAGSSSFLLLPEISDKLYSKMGISFWLEGEKSEPFVQTWAPYKQITVHPTRRFGKELLWSGDGTAIIPKNWKEEREEDAWERIKKAGNFSNRPFAIFRGLRPFSKGKEKPCWWEEIRKNVFIATGGGKFGILAAGWLGKEIEKNGI